jgi:hypothetical protein
MLFQVKCVHCERIAILKSEESELAESAEQAASMPLPHLDGYIVDCPACRKRRQWQTLPAPALNKLCKPRFSGDVPRNAA